MKKSLLRHGAMIAAALFIANGLLAQDTLNFKTLPPITVTATDKKIPEKVWNNFRTYFTTATNPKWYDANKNYLVKFMTDEDYNGALFSKKGRLIYHVSYGYKNNLPADLSTQVKNSYLDYYVTSTIRVSEDQRVVWLVNIENAKYLIIVRLEDGELEEVDKLKKI